jgi:hypothetical protein
MLVVMDIDYTLYMKGHRVYGVSFQETVMMNEVPDPQDPHGSEAAAKTSLRKFLVKVVEEVHPP